MLRAQKRMFFSTYHLFLSDEYFGTLKASQFKPLATFIAENGNYIFFREHARRGKYFCELEERYLAIAENLAGLGVSFEVRHLRNRYTLNPGERFQKHLEFHYHLLKGNDIIGCISENPTKFYLDIDIHDDIPPVIQCFIFWLAFRAWVGTRGWMKLPGYGNLLDKMPANKNETSS